MDMRCPKCNSLVREGEAFCIVCGASFAQPEVKTEPLTDVPTNLTTSVNNESVGTVNNSVYNNSQNVRNIAEETFSDDDLINAYIGKNSDTLRDGSFSWCYFFFGQYYLLYRKLWIPFIVINVISSIVSKILVNHPIIYYILSLLASLLICGAFKSFYLRHVTDEVEKIKNKNPSASNKDLVMICSKNGGTSWGIIILYFVFIRVLARFLSF